MTAPRWQPILEQIRSLAARPDTPVSDAELLSRFVARHDETAFEALLRRHGPMVLRVARRVLKNQSDAEDVFQATFLLLARRAGAIRKRESVASWLHGVAHRLALSARGKRARRQECERHAAVRAVETPPESAWSELEETLHEVLTQLPAKYRTPLVYCYLEGRTQEEAARDLAVPLGTLRSWLARGRELLRKRLVRRGVSLSTEGASAALLASACATTEAVPPSLRLATVKAAHLFATGGNAMTLISPAVAVLVRKGLTAMLVAKLKSGVSAVLILALLVAGSGWAAHRTFRAKPPEANETAEKASPKQAASEERPRTDAFGDPLPPGAIARLGCLRLRHGGNAYSLAYSPDGKLLASGGSDGWLRLWDPSTGKEMRRIRGHDNNVFCIAFSRDGKLLASCGNDGIPGISARIWDVGTGKRLLNWEPWRTNIQALASFQALAFSPDGKVLAAGSSGGDIYFYDIESRKILHRLVGKRLEGAGGNGIDTIAFSPDGATLFSATHYEAILRRWAVAKGEELPPLTGHKKGTWWATLALDGRGRSLACCGVDGICRIWDLSSGKVRLRIGGGKTSISYPTFSPDGRTLAGTVGNQVHFWDAATGKELRHFQTTTWLQGLTFSPDGSTLAGRDQNAIYLVDSQTGRQRLQHKGHKGMIGRVAFSSDGTKILTSGSDNTTRVWEARTGQELSRHQGYARAFSPDGKMAASSAEDGKSICLWDTVTGKDIHRLPGEAPNFVIDFHAHAFSADGKYFASYGGKDAPIRVWETATGRERCQISVKGLLHALALSPDGGHVAAVDYPSLNKPIQVWDIASGRERKALSRKNSSVSALAFAPDGVRAAAAGVSPGVRFWDVRTGENRGQIAVPRSHLVSGLAFSPDGKTLATIGGSQGFVYLWEIATGTMRMRWEGHVGRVRTAAFSADGKLLVTGGDDGTPLVWDVMDVVPSRKGQQAKLTPEVLAENWTALSSEDAETAWRAARRLVAGSEQTVAFLRERLSAQAAIAEKVAQWIAELDDDSFAVREQASRELAALGKPTIPALRKAQASSPCAEVARRLKDLLAKLDKPGLSSAELASLRAIEVLEYLGTAEARQLLAKLAKGAVDARLTQEAKASLRRLEKRAKKP